MMAPFAYRLALAAVVSLLPAWCDRDARHHKHRQPSYPIVPGDPKPPPSDDDGDDDTDWGPFGHHGNKPGNSPDHRQDGDHRNDRSEK